MSAPPASTRLTRRDVLAGGAGLTMAGATASFAKGPQPPPAFGRLVVVNLAGADDGPLRLPDGAASRFSGGERILAVGGGTPFVDSGASPVALVQPVVLDLLPLPRLADLLDAPGPVGIAVAPVAPTIRCDASPSADRWHRFGSLLSIRTTRLAFFSPDLPDTADPLTGLAANVASLRAGMGAAGPVTALLVLGIGGPDHAGRRRQAIFHMPTMPRPEVGATSAILARVFGGDPPKRAPSA